ncbi:HVO_0234 family beta-propeller protein [Halovenus sp. HT40]|uniref:HVO_0234 family beta-propeller protein n=1 Tax=Halovenus sp. HT40 TaxID=3126691 RepID=UPI00300EF8CD
MTELEPDDDGDEVEGDNADDERMLFGEKREETTLLAGSGLGVTRIDVAAAQVGQFSLLDRGTVHGLATDGQTVIVATDEAVSRRTGDGLQSLRFGPAAAVGIDGKWVYAADSERVARLDRTGGLADATAEDWETVGSVDDPQRFVGNLLAAAELLRVGEDLEAVGLSDVRDLSPDGALAAAADGIYENREGDWERVYEGDATAVVADGERAHAVVDGRLLERDGEGWTELSLPGTEPHLLAYGQTLAVIDTEGTVHVAADPGVTHDGHGGWRSQAIGLRDVTSFLALRE